MEPTHKSLLLEILQRSTRMPVEQVKDGMRVERDHVYVIPPNKDMSLLHGKLNLSPQASARGVILPIDFFFRSLAEDQGERALGVVLSGMGTDGTLGLRAIREKGGATFVQALISAKFDGMPRSAIDAGVADVIAPVEELPKKVLEYHRRFPPFDFVSVPSDDKTLGVFSPRTSSQTSRQSGCGPRIYHKLELPAAAVPVDFPSAPLGMHEAKSEMELEATQQKSTAPNLQALADRLVLQNFAPVAVLCNDRGDLLYVSRRAGKYLEPAAGKANLNVFAMAREGLRFELSRAFSAAVHDHGVISVSGVQVGTNGGTQIIDLRVQKLTEPKELRGTVLIVFKEAVAGPTVVVQPRTRRISAPAREAELEQELQRSREEIQTTREEMQISQEELKSTNEELQSTNEELTTSKEELQSLNEELQSVNHELQSKVDELSRANNDSRRVRPPPRVGRMPTKPFGRARPRMGGGRSLGGRGRLPWTPDARKAECPAVRCRCGRSQLVVRAMGARRASAHGSS